MGATTSNHFFNNCEAMNFQNVVDINKVVRCARNVEGKSSNSASPSDLLLFTFPPNSTYNGEEIQGGFQKVFISNYTQLLPLFFDEMTIMGTIDFNSVETHINGEFKGTGDDKIDGIVKTITRLILEGNVIPSLQDFIESDETLTLISKRDIDTGAEKILKEIVYPKKKPIIFTDGGDPWDLFVKDEYEEDWDFKDFQRYPLTKDELLEMYDIDYACFIIPPDTIAETEAPFKSEEDVINYILDKTLLRCENCGVKIPSENECDFCYKKLCDNCADNVDIQFITCYMCSRTWCHCEKRKYENCEKRTYGNHCNFCSHSR